MKVVDSSAWIEFFTDGHLASRFEPYLSDPDEVVTPTIVLYEVYELIRRERDEEAGLVALTAADLALEHRLAMADAIVYATARLEGAEVVTADEGFRGLPGVVCHGKKRPSAGGARRPKR